MAQVTLESVSKMFDQVVAVRDVSLTVDDKEFVVLVGPSGCGKSTTLRMIAGLEEITSGTIKIGERVVNDVPPKDRDIAMVFQNYALYPHMSVYDNMAFGLKLRKFPKTEIQQRVKEAAEILGIQELLARKPRALSGGQRQRVAVGRAIVRKPQVFLFDEPLSNLDAKLRVAMRAELKKLHHRLQATVVYVTHDQVEAMTMGDRIVIMKDGVIQQVGAPLEVYAFPQNLFVAGFIGSPAMNFVRCTVSTQNGGLCFTAPGLNLAAPASKAKALAAYKDKPVTMGIRPEDLHESTPQDPPSGQRKKNPAAYYNFEVECMGTGMDGTQLIKAWGYGKRPNDAIEQAKKNAVQAVMFKGITSGQPGCMMRPLITDPGAEQQHQDYFVAFFKEKGKYLNFVNVSNDGSIDPKDRLKAGKEYKIGVLVSVSHAALRKELESAGIIKALGQGF